LPSAAIIAASWIARPARYLAVVTLANLAWELAQIPLYTIWREGTPGEILFAIAHCTLGDALIAAASLGIAIAATGGRRCFDERARFRRLAIATIGIAVAYTVFSEWLNVSVRGSWAYAESMPVAFGIGVSPLPQWVVTPLLAFRIVRPRPSLP
jgi:hypothetical protein